MARGLEVCSWKLGICGAGCGFEGHRLQRLASANVQAAHPDAPMPQWPAYWLHFPAFRVFKTSKLQTHGRVH